MASFGSIATIDLYAPSLKRLMKCRGLAPPIGASPGELRLWLKINGLFDDSTSRADGRTHGRNMRPQQPSLLRAQAQLYHVNRKATSVRRLAPIAMRQPLNPLPLPQATREPTESCAGRRVLKPTVAQRRVVGSDDLQTGVVRREETASRSLGRKSDRTDMAHVTNDTGTDAMAADAVAADAMAADAVADEAVASNVVESASNIEDNTICDISAVSGAPSKPVEVTDPLEVTMSADACVPEPTIDDETSIDETCIVDNAPPELVAQVTPPKEGRVVRPRVRSPVELEVEVGKGLDGGENDVELVMVAPAGQAGTVTERAIADMQAVEMRLRAADTIGTHQTPQPPSTHVSSLLATLPRDV